MGPLIGITTRPRLVHASAGDMLADTLSHTYRDGVTRGGGIPVLLTAVEDDAVPTLLDRIDGLLLTGGGDVDPTLYGSEPTKEMYGIDPKRDRFEIALAREAHRRKMPVLAICRGIQILNVALGGTLIEDIPNEIGTSQSHAEIGDRVYDTHQNVRIDESCGLAALVGVTELGVNSIHHQALRRVADGIHPVAWADDGVIEAIEADDDWPLIGVQWHPEYLDSVGDDASRRLFAAFVGNAAAARTATA